ncbi:MULTISPECIES: kinase [Enterococcus]|uniref:kinase n=1 Tax=Enterococcus TaxID=1350 RepID=UPI0015C5083B|nr:kinase [Enterococcus faecalis]
MESFFQVFCSFLLVFNNQENGGKQMQPKLIILRGNSGSGKTTIAKALHQCLKEQSLLISQDVVRREMLRVKDETGNLSIALLKQLVAFGYQECQYVIVEGIFQKAIYHSFFQEIIHLFEGNVQVYYFDISFEETLKRHSQRNKNQEFGVVGMKRWWLPEDYLELPGEKRLSEQLSEKQIIRQILADIQ